MSRPADKALRPGVHAPAGFGARASLHVDPETMTLLPDAPPVIVWPETRARCAYVAHIAAMSRYLARVAPSLVAAEVPA